MTGVANEAVRKVPAGVEQQNPPGIPHTQYFSPLADVYCRRRLCRGGGSRRAPPHRGGRKSRVKSWKYSPTELEKVPSKGPNQWETLMGRCLSTKVAVVYFGGPCLQSTNRADDGHDSSEGLFVSGRASSPPHWDPLAPQYSSKKDRQHITCFSSFLVLGNGDQPFLFVHPLVSSWPVVTLAAAF